MPGRPTPDIFKAYDIRGLYGEQIDGDARRADRARVRARARRAGGQAGRASCASALGRDMRLTAPELAGALSRRAAGARARTCSTPAQVGDRDALLPRRLARARRRADVHGLAQPEGLHRREARARGRDRAVGRQRHRATSADDRGRAGRRLPSAPAARQRSSRSTCYGEFQRRGAALHRPARPIERR